MDLFADPADRIDTLAYDVSYIAQRHAHALSRFKTTEGLVSGHVYGVFKQIKIQVMTLRPRRLCFLYDRGAPWRKELLPTYKASRRKSLTLDDEGPATPEPTEEENLGLKFTQDPNWSPGPDVERLCRSIPGIHLALQDYEADDCAGVLRKALPREDRQGSLVFYTMDRDYWQLVSDEENVQVMFSGRGKGKKGEITVNEKMVEKQFGCLPQHIPALKAMLGDTSDDVRGLQGASRPGKKKALLEFVIREGAMYLDEKNLDWEPSYAVPDWLLEEILAQRQDMIRNLKVTDLGYAAERARDVGWPPLSMEPGDRAKCMNVLAEFQCDSLLGQVDQMFRMMGSNAR